MEHTKGALPAVLTTENFLACCLIDALEEGNLKFVETLLKDKGANPNRLIVGKDISPMHFAVGVDDEEFAEKATKLLLEFGGNPNIQTNDDLTPLHIAADAGREKIFLLLLCKGGDYKLLDNEQNSPIHYAIYGEHFEVVETIQQYLVNEKQKKLLAEKASRTATVLQNLSLNLLEAKTPEHLNKSLTINKRLYNFDRTSPYYINITHRKKDTQYQQVINNMQNRSPMRSHKQPTESAGDVVNVFDLTQENLELFTKNIIQPKTTRMNLINSWRENVRDSVAKDINKTMDFTTKINKLESLFKNLPVQDADKSKILNISMSGKITTTGEITEDEKSFQTAHNDTFKTVNEEDLGENEDNKTAIIVITSSDEKNKSRHLDANSTASFIKSPDIKQHYIEEDYLHTDSECHIQFCEKKIYFPHNVTQHDVSLSTVSTAVDVPLDYDTDTLRQELTTFGEPPGPITSSTKQLYLKKLIKIKRNPGRLLYTESETKKQQRHFSIELQKTLRNPEWVADIPNYLELEKQMTEHFQNTNNKKFREGHLKQSFIYLLLDPRISDNLPIKSKLLTEDEMWSRFILSIFYVGKGKSSRPYSHLYDAIKYYSQQDMNQFKMVDAIASSSRTTLKALNVAKPNTNCLLNSPTTKKKLAESGKLMKILDIWSEHKGIVCLHIFHNIIPVEAYTREASIIDCLDKQNLTNEKRGNYYGSTQSWTMRQRKQLGIILLYRAMKIYLAEGESQIMPNDLV